MDQIENNEIMFDLPTNKRNIIKVIGVGGGGSNAVSAMFKLGIKDVDFMICNTDAQHLEASLVPMKLQLGSNLTEGMGAGSIPEMGKQAALESIRDVKNMIGDHTKMVFITAGMGGGTGTGAAPVIAEECRNLGILTVGIVTIPFKFEGRKRRLQAEEGLRAMAANVDCLIVVSNDRLSQIFANLGVSDAFAKADSVLSTAAKSIAEIITVTGTINVDFKDIETVMRNSGKAIMGTGIAEGHDRAVRATEEALNSPLLNDNDISDARYVLLNITSGLTEVTMNEIAEITDFIQENAGYGADVIWGTCRDESLGEGISVTVIATGFTGDKADALRDHTTAVPQKTVLPLDPKPEMVAQPAPAPVQPTVTIDESGKEKTVFQLDPTPVVEPTRAEEPITFEFEFKPTQAPTFEVERPVYEQPIAPPVYQQPVFEQPTYQQPTPAPSEEPAPVSEKDTDGWQVIQKDPDTLNSFETPATPAPSNSDISRPMGTRTVHPDTTASRADVLRQFSMMQPLDHEKVQEMESVPAYQRSGVTLEPVHHSSDKTSSSYSLNTDGERTIIRPNNPFLHDNVD